MSDRELFIVEVDSFQGEHRRIDVCDASGAPLRALYCVAARNPKSGVLQFVDYGYETLEEARQAWPNAR
ncbi:hypothetical protein [Gemmatimonas sp.]|jgi:hypothetical protein|uniref:hypothetical protein n=1 Tax=Gemmatimonas sp. TaxID=1962908 RepID=UPI0037C03604